MRLWRRNRRVRFHLVDAGRVLDESVEGVLLRRRGGFYVLIDAIVLARGEDGGMSRQTVSGEYEVPVARVVGREVRG